MHEPLFILPRRREWQGRTSKLRRLRSIPATAEDATQLLPFIGGKALGLLTLERLKQRVPAWGVLTTVLYNHWQPAAEDTTAASLSLNLPDWQADLCRFYRLLSANGRYPLAVRSSATVEDHAQASFAGQFKSVLRVRSFPAFLKAIAGVWASTRVGAAAYPDGKTQVSMAIVVQRFLAARTAGVAFSQDPLKGNKNHVYIQSLWGQGEGLVSGKLEADSFLFDAFGMELKRIVVEKPTRLGFSGDAQSVLKPVPRRLVKKPSLSRPRLAQLYRTVKALGLATGMAVDVEFLLTAGKLYILQLRPVTAAGSPDFRKDNFRVWDNSNIVESYAGITLPLTFSYIQYVYSVVYKEFFKAMYIPGDIIKHYRDIYPHMLGYIKGRVYYNLINWYLVIAELPGFKNNKGYMELMMGVNKTLEYIPVHEKRGLKKIFYYLPRGLWTTWILVYNFFGMTGKIKSFIRHFYKEYNQYRQLDLASMNPLEVLRLAERLEERILFSWKAPIINDIKAMIYYGILKKLTGKWYSEQDAHSHNALLAAQGDIVSLKIVRELEELAAEVKQHPALNKLLSSAEPAAILGELDANPAFHGFKQRFDHYLEQYGFRSVEELKLEAVPNKQNPQLCLNMLKNYLTRRSAPDRGPEPGSSGTAADTDFLKKLSLPKRLVYGFVLKQTKQAIKDREAQRFCRAQIFDFMRSITEHLGTLWQQSGILRHHRDIYYLTVDEIRAYIRGISYTGDLPSIIELRKKEITGYQGLHLPDRFVTYGEATHYPIEEESVVVPGKIIRGEGCSPGIVEGRVVILEKPDAGTRLNGEIVVARQTDPGWVILYPAISGLLIEKGSMLSHSAIVAREMKLPTIVALPGISRLLKSGQHVKMDGALGTVEILD